MARHVISLLLHACIAGTIASYAAVMTSVDHNLIIANYGASQGFDTDDGSSWYDIHHNFFFQSDGWKMDYGGHDSKFTDNVVYGGNGQNCFNAQSFLPSHGVEWSRNKCALTHSKTIGESSGCKCPGVVPHSAAPGTSSCGLTLKGNEYFLVATGSLGKVNASIGCSGDGVTFEEWQGNGSDVDATLSTMPSDELLVSWGRALLGMPALPGPVPPNPGPLPPAPTPHFPHTCQGQCNKAGFGCVGATSGCNQPSCAQGCLIANATRSAKICAAACKSMVHQCTWTVLNVSSGKNVTLDECNSCTFASRASSFFSHPYFQRCASNAWLPLTFAHFRTSPPLILQALTGCLRARARKRVIWAARCFSTQQLRHRLPLRRQRGTELTMHARA